MRRPSPKICGAILFLVIPVASDAHAQLRGVRYCEVLAVYLRDGALEALTADHSARRRLIEEDGLSEEEAEQHSAAHTLERAIGPEDGVDIEVRPVSVAPGDVFMLCSDGLWGLVSDDDIAAIMAAEPPEACVRTLVAELTP